MLDCDVCLADEETACSALKMHRRRVQLVRDAAYVNALPIPRPPHIDPAMAHTLNGRYKIGEIRRHNGSDIPGRGEYTTNVYADVRQTVSGCLDVTFYTEDGRPVQRAIRLAVDGSWRDNCSLLPVNIRGVEGG